MFRRSVTNDIRTSAATKKTCPDLSASRPAIGRVDALQAARFGVIATPNRDMRRRRDPSTKTILLAGTCNG